MYGNVNSHFSCVLQDNLNWIFSLVSTRGYINKVTSIIGENIPTDLQSLSDDIDFYTDSCWRRVYQHSAAGTIIAGSSADLINSIGSGNRVKIIIGTTALESDDLRIKGGIVCSSFLNRVTKNGIEYYDDSFSWTWTIACTTGNVRVVRYKVGSNELVESVVTTETLTWFVDQREWTKALVTDQTGGVLFGGKGVFLSQIQAGAEVRYRITFDESVQGFAESGFSLVQQADSIRWSGNEFSAMHVRSVSTEAVEIGEVAFSDDAYWCFSIISTTGKLEISRWTVGEHTSRGKTTNQVAVEWFINE